MSHELVAGMTAMRQRKRLLLCSVCALALLLVSLWFALSARNDLNGALTRLADIQRQQRELQQFQHAHESWQHWYQDVQELQHSLQQDRFSATHWRERGLTVESARMSRQQAQAYLTSLEHGEGYYFLPERFELKVLQDSDDLLRWRDGSTDELEMTLVGRYFIRSEK